MICGSLAGSNSHRMGYTETPGLPPGGGFPGGLDLAGSVRCGHTPIGVIVIHAILSVAAVVVLVLGPFLVECRASSGTVTARFLFADCPPDAECCSLPEACGNSSVADAETDSGIMDDGSRPRGGCSDAALFTFVGSRSSRDDCRSVGSVPHTIAVVHPADRLTVQRADVRLAAATAPDVPPPPDEILCVLRN